MQLKLKSERRSLAAKVADLLFRLFSVELCIGMDWGVSGVRIARMNECWKNSEVAPNQESGLLSELAKCAFAATPVGT